MAYTQNSRSYSGGKYGLELDHTMAGWIKEVDGGHAVADVVEEKMGSDHLTRKHLGNVQYDEVTFKCGTGMSKGVYEWIKTGFDQSSNTRGRENGAVLFADYDQSEIARLTFQHALLSEYTLPALDAGSKDAAMMTIKFKPETARKERGKGTKITMPANAAAQKKWLPSNFKLEIDGMNCDRVSKIEALTVKQKIVVDAVGQRREYELVPANVAVPNLEITISEAYADDWYKWHEDFVILGRCDEKYEKRGTLYYLAPDTEQRLFTLTFFNLGIFKIAPEKVEAGAESVRRVKISMYCEDIKFDYSNSEATFGAR
ncbi:MAG TPA: phage tail protein [Pseudomonadota bacterium]|nr:phage tail protein [Pseudomonadota bacterium]